ncbi:MAG: fluoride efflux transporter CrcB [Candidatus Tantalella remota]|nr:fluoride efflux transporter CrcB [Candidatus Tantalella remota]
MVKILYLIIGGTIGTVSRYGVSGFVHRVLGANFPYGTLTVNFAGCFLIGLLAALADKKFLLNVNARVFLMIGFCGAFTTFSTFMLETSNLIDNGETMRAFMNLFLSVVVGFAVFRLGLLMGEIL